MSAKSAAKSPSAKPASDTGLTGILVVPDTAPSAVPDAKVRVVAAKCPVYSVTMITDRLPEIKTNALYSVSLFAFSGLKRAENKPTIAPSSNSEFKDGDVVVRKANIGRFYLPYFGSEVDGPNHLLQPFHNPTKQWFYVVTAPNPTSAFDYISLSISNGELHGIKQPYCAVLIRMTGNSLMNADAFFGNKPVKSGEFGMVLSGLKLMLFIVSSTVNNPFKITGYAEELAERIEIVKMQIMGIVSSFVLFYKTGDAVGKSLTDYITAINDWFKFGLENKGAHWDTVLGIFNFVGVRCFNMMHSQGINETCGDLTDGGFTQFSSWLAIPKSKSREDSDGRGGPRGRSGDHGRSRSRQPSQSRDRQRSQSRGRQVHQQSGSFFS